jgi:hypothetical protein
MKDDEWWMKLLMRKDVEWVKRNNEVIISDVYLYLYLYIYINTVSSDDWDDLGEETKGK